MATYNPKLPPQVLAYFGLPSLPDGSNSLRYDSATIARLRSIDRQRNRLITSFSNIHPDGRTNYTSPANNNHWAWNSLTSRWMIVGATTGSWIASLISSDLPPASPTETPSSTSTPTPTINVTTTPTRTLIIPTPTSTPTSSLIKDCLQPSVYPDKLNFIGQKKYQIIFRSTRSNCDTSCTNKMIINIKLYNLDKNITTYYNFVVPDDSQSCCGGCEDNTNFKLVNEFYTTFIFEDLIVGDRYLMESTADTILPTTTPTQTITPTVTPTISISPTLTPTISITPTTTSTPTITPTITITPSISPPPLEIRYFISLAADQTNICNGPCSRTYTISALLGRTNGQVISPQPQLYFEFQQERSFDEWPEAIGGFAALNNTGSQAFSFTGPFPKRIRAIITYPENGLSVTTFPIAPNIVFV